ncbi:MAG TPA: ATP-binding protein [Vicinamibacterales bacterium]|nr:ATP-binding protein [Vicinamibacterales bacterium]
MISRLEREVRTHQRLRDLLLQFSRQVAVNHRLTPALETLAPEVRDALGAAGVEIWLHDRRARRLTLAASAGGREPGLQVAADAASHEAAEALRLERTAVRGPRLVAPLRGWRRALGALIITPPPGAPEDDGLVDFTHELARQLSVGIENVQLLEDILLQRRLLEDTFNSLVDLVAVVDLGMRIVQTNDAFASRVGATRQQLIGQNLAHLVSADTLAYVACPDPHDATTPAQRRVDDDRLNGTFLLTATPLTREDGTTHGRVLVARDITRQTRLEAERAALRERLAQSAKLASLGQFVAGIAHEMNNPLQGVLGHLELLIDMTEAARPVRRELKQIYQEAERAAKIVHNLLVFTGSHRMDRHRVPLDRVVTRAIASCAVQLQRGGVQVEREKGPRLRPVNVDAMLLQQALVNILLNAEHAVRGAPERRIRVTTSAGRTPDTVAVTVQDSGPGIAEEALPRIFDPFFTTKEVGQGTGLGLAITYGIVHEHDGTIAATNAPDGGAVFRIELPAAEG